MHSPNFLFLRFLVLSLANPSNGPILATFHIANVFLVIIIIIQSASASIQ